MAQLIAANNIGDLVGPPTPPRCPSAGIGPIAITRNPWDAISDKKFTCSHGELAHAPFPHATIGSFILSLNALRSFGRKTVCVASALSEAITALYGPVPPSSITRMAISAEATGGAESAFALCT